MNEVTIRMIYIIKIKQHRVQFKTHTEDDALFA
jgi:hypothetical protein